MGLFDGPARRDGGSASTAHVADAAPRAGVLVVDASAQARTVGRARARLRAPSTPRVRVAGVILNRVGSDRHEAVLRAALRGGRAAGARRAAARARSCARAVAAPRAGARRPSAAAAAPQRWRRWPSWWRAHVDLDAVAAARPPAPPLGAPAVGPGRGGRPAGARRRAAGGRGRRRAGVHLRLRRDRGAAGGGRAPRSSPSTRCATSAARTGTAALVLGGGFPEVHAAALSANAPLRAAVAALAASGAPIARRVRRAALPLPGARRRPDGRRPAARRAAMTARLTLGYRDAVALTDSAPFAAGQRVTGHEFHRSR